MKSKPLLVVVLGLGLFLALIGSLVYLPNAAQAWAPALQGGASVQAAAGTAFTYQGRLTDGGSPASGTYDLEFKLYDAATSGSLIGTATQDDVAVSDGLFAVALDFGGGVFNGEARWLEVGVRPGSSAGAYTALAPRQALTPAPYALALPGLWTEQNATSPNVIGGFSGNSVSGGVVGATVGGGGVGGAPNQVRADYGTVGGGQSNSVSADYATVGGGEDNTASFVGATVAGGGGNTAGGPDATVGGGASNTASGRSAVVAGGGGIYLDGDIAFQAPNEAGGEHSTVAGGGDNTASGMRSVVGGGFANAAGGRSSTIAGGEGNTAGLDFATVGGGLFNYADAVKATIGGGEFISVTGEAATVAGGQHITVTGQWAAVGGGARNAVSRPQHDRYDSASATIAGGDGNVVSEAHATVGGGGNNTASGYASVVAGGGGYEDYMTLLPQWTPAGNAAGGDWSTVSGGALNEAKGIAATIGGGRFNTAVYTDTTIAGGASNTASGEGATVGGGCVNEASGKGAVVGGGCPIPEPGVDIVWNNLASGDYSTVGGGIGNEAGGSYATIAGGFGNQATAVYATIAGGGMSDPDSMSSTGNRVTDGYGTVGGGGNNQAGNANAEVGDAMFATVSGGEDNAATWSHATVGGGEGNTASGLYATVGGGRSNSAGHDQATIAGGDGNVANNIFATVGGGVSNTANGFAATIPGGDSNTAEGFYSFAAGYRAKANHDGAFVWADSTDADFASTAVDQFAVRANGGALITGTSSAPMLTVTNLGNADGLRVNKSGDDGLQIGDGTDFPNYGVYIPDDGVSYTALSVQTAEADGEWALITGDKISAANVTFSSLTSVAVVDGPHPLTPGDLVAAAGLADPLPETLSPLPRVRLADAKTWPGVIGVVEGRMALQPMPGKADKDGNAPLELHSVPGPAKAGDYVALTVSGVAHVKADATAGEIVAGQRLTAADQPGHARTLRTRMLEGMVVTEGAPVIGIALAPLDKDTGTIPVFVTLR